MKKIFVTAAALTLTLGASAQGNNTGMGGDMRDAPAWLSAF